MIRYLVDTTTVIDFSKGVEPVSSRLLALIDAGDDVGVCAVVVAEFSSGLTPESPITPPTSRCPASACCPCPMRRRPRDGAGAAHRIR